MNQKPEEVNEILGAIGAIARGIGTVTGARAIARQAITPSSHGLRATTRNLKSNIKTRFAGAGRAKAIDRERLRAKGMSTYMTPNIGKAIGRAASQTSAGIAGFAAPRAGVQAARQGAVDSMRRARASGSEAFKRYEGGIRLVQNAKKYARGLESPAMRAQRAQKAKVAKLYRTPSGPPMVFAPSTPTYRESFAPLETVKSRINENNSSTTQTGSSSATQSAQQASQRLKREEQKITGINGEEYTIRTDSTGSKYMSSFSNRAEQDAFVKKFGNIENARKMDAEGNAAGAEAGMKAIYAGGFAPDGEDVGNELVSGELMKKNNMKLAARTKKVEDKMRDKFKQSQSKSKTDRSNVENRMKKGFTTSLSPQEQEKRKRERTTMSNTAKADAAKRRARGEKKNTMGFDIPSPSNNPRDRFNPFPNLPQM